MDVSALCPEIPPDSSNALSGLCMPTPQTSACSALKESPPAAFFRGLPRAAGVVSARAVRNNEQFPKCVPRSPSSAEASLLSGAPRWVGRERGFPCLWSRAARPLPCCFLREPSLGKSLPSHASASGKETRSKVLAAQCHPHPLPAWPGGGPRPARTPGSQHRAEGRRHLGEWGRASGWGGAHGEENRGGSPWVDLKDPGAQARSAWRGEGLGGGLAATTSAFESDSPAPCSPPPGGPTPPHTPAGPGSGPANAD